MSELGPANDDLRNCESAGSRDRIRLATGPQADESYATNRIASLRASPPTPSADS